MVFFLPVFFSRETWCLCLSAPNSRIAQRDAKALTVVCELTALRL